MSDVPVRAESPVVSSSRAVDLDLDQIEARANAATPGPWETSVHAMPGASVDEWFVREIVYDPDPRFHRLNVLKVRGASHAARECCWPPSDADAVFIAHAREDVPALVAEVRRLRQQVGLLEAERDPRVVDELRDLWQRALEREGNLASAVADVIWKATQYGTTEGGDTHAYLVPKGCMHRLVGVAQQNGAHVPVAFRASNEPIEDVDPHIERLTAERDAARAEVDQWRENAENASSYRAAAESDRDEACAEAERQRERADHNAAAVNENADEIVRLREESRRGEQSRSDAYQRLVEDRDRYLEAWQASVAEAARVREALQAVRDILDWLTSMGEPTHEALETRRVVTLSDIIYKARAALRALDAALDGAE